MAFSPFLYPCTMLILLKIKILYFLDYASSSESEIESSAIDSAWIGDCESDAESVDSEQEDCLKYSSIPLLTSSPSPPFPSFPSSGFYFVGRPTGPPLLPILLKSCRFSFSLLGFSPPFPPLSPPFPLLSPYFTMI